MESSFYESESDDEQGFVALHRAGAASTSTKRKPSPLCQFFEEFRSVLPDGTNMWRAICRKCGEDIDLKSQYAHKKRCFPTEVGPPQVRALTEAQIIAWTAEWIVGTDQPLSIVENEAHTLYLTRLNPTYIPVSRQSVTRYIWEEFSRRKNVLLDYFRASKNNVALTSSVWRGPSLEYYVSVVAHYIDSDWKLNKRVIAFRVLGLKYTGQDISDNILSVINEWGLDNRVVAITSDNALSDSAALSIIGDRLSRTHREQLFHQKCAFRITNLLIKEGKEHANVHVDRIRTNISWLRNSAENVAAWKLYCAQMGIQPVKFELDQETRWNSTNEMLKSVLKHRQVFNDFIEAERGHEFINANDWKIAETLQAFLEAFYENILRLSRSPTFNNGLQCLFRITYCFKKFENDEVLEDIIKVMKEKYLKYWDPIPFSYSVGIILDPRFNITLFEALVDEIGNRLAIDYTSYIADTKAIFKDLYSEYEQRYPAPIRTQPQPEPEQQVALTPQAAQADIHNLLRGRRQARRLKLMMNDDQTGQPAELTRYYEHNLGFDVDIFQWWEEQSANLPILSRMARDLLSIPPAIVSSETAFSTSGNIIRERRDSPTSEMMEALTVLKDWYAVEKRKQPGIASTSELTDRFNDFYVD